MLKPICTLSGTSKCRTLNSVTLRLTIICQFFRFSGDRTSNINIFGMFESIIEGQKGKPPNKIWKQKCTDQETFHCAAENPKINSSSLRVSCLVVGFYGSVLPQFGIQPTHFTEGLGIHWDGQWDGKWPTNIDLSPHGLCFTIIPTLWFSMTVCLKMRFYCKPLDVGIQTNHDKPIWLFDKPVLTNCTIGISDVFKYEYIYIYNISNIIFKC